MLSFLCVVEYLRRIELGIGSAKACDHVRSKIIKLGVLELF